MAARGLLLLSTLVLPASPAEFYVSPAAHAAGTGSQSNPWSLATAFSPPSAVRPGDTIWLRGGVYSGWFRSELRGTEAAPIIVRQYPGERAIIDGASSNNPTLTIMGAYTWYWGFEVTNSLTNRVNPDPVRPEGVNVFGPGTKCINLVVHDTGQGFGAWIPAIGAELYGNIVYYNGSLREGRSSGHGIYVQNDTGTKLIAENIVFSQYQMGIHAYSSGSPINNIDIESNVVFENGSISHSGGRSGQILLGGNTHSNNGRINGNYVYTPFSLKDGTSINPCYGDGCIGLTFNNNYLVSGNYSVNSAAPLAEVTQATGNTLIAPWLGDQPRQYIPASDNTILNLPPTTNRVFVRPNKFEPGRATVVVYNWSLANEVSVSLSGVLSAGDTYEVRNVQNYFGGPVLTGTYSGEPLRLPISLPSLTAVIGSSPVPPASASPTFGTFVVQRTSTGSTAPPAPPQAPEPEPEPAPTPTPAPAPTPSEQVVLRLEAESATLTPPMENRRGDPTSSGWAYLTSFFSNYGAATLTFTVPVAGQYTVWARTLAATPASDTFFVRVDSGPEQIFDAAGLNGWSSSWQWQRLNARIGEQRLGINPWILNLTPGQHTIRFRGRGAATYLDRLIITNVPGFTPPPDPPSTCGGCTS